MTSGQLRRSQSMENFIKDIILEENIPESDIPTFQRRLCPGKTAIGQKFAFAYVDKVIILLKKSLFNGSFIRKPLDNPALSDPKLSGFLSQNITILGKSI